MTDVLTRVATGGLPALEEYSGPLTCTAVIDVTHDVRSFVFELPGGRALGFRPGQYLTFSFEVDGRRLERCYTVSSSPAQPAAPTITVKRVPGGPVSTWLHDQLRVGDTVHASGPLGTFSTVDHPSDRYLFLSAGSGITPVMSMTRDLRDRGDPADVVFVHCARSPRDIVFRSELERLVGSGHAAVSILCEDDCPGETWDGPRGRLSLATLLGAAPDLLDRDIFTCGPPPFMAAVRELLTLLAADPLRCHEESFLLGASAQAVASTPEDTAPSYRVELLRSGRVIDCDAGTTVLEAAARAGVTLLSSCGEGVCGTCKSTMVSGRVEMHHGGGIRQREIDDGRILLCCSRPRDDLRIDV